MGQRSIFFLITQFPKFPFFIKKTPLSKSQFYPSLWVRIYLVWNIWWRVMTSINSKLRGWFRHFRSKILLPKKAAVSLPLPRSYRSGRATVESASVITALEDSSPAGHLTNSHCRKHWRKGSLGYHCSMDVSAVHVYGLQLRGSPWGAEINGTDAMWKESNVLLSVMIRIFKTTHRPRTIFSL